LPHLAAAPVDGAQCSCGAAAVGSSTLLVLHPSAALDPSARAKFSLRKAGLAHRAGHKGANCGGLLEQCVHSGILHSTRGTRAQWHQGLGVMRAWHELAARARARQRLQGQARLSQYCACQLAGICSAAWGAGLRATPSQRIAQNNCCGQAGACFSNCVEGYGSYNHAPCAPPKAIHASPKPGTHRQERGQERVGQQGSHTVVVLHCSRERGAKNRGGSGAPGKAWVCGEPAGAAAALPNCKHSGAGSACPRPAGWAA